jgi:hypothetical protein
MAENFVGSTRVEQWQRSTVPADFHHVRAQPIGLRVFNPEGRICRPLGY